MHGEGVVKYNNGLVVYGQFKDGYLRDTVM